MVTEMIGIEVARVDRSKKERTIERLQKALDKAPQLRKLSTSSLVFKSWRKYTEKAIARAYGEDYDAVREFTEISFSPPSSQTYALSEALWGQNVPRMSDQGAFDIGLSKASVLLTSYIEDIEDFWDDGEGVPDTASPSRAGQMDSKRIFVVHGRDKGPKHEVARFLGGLGLVPVILDEQADKGRTIIDKFEEEAREVGFAVVILTPDDEGRLRNSDAKPSARARQNVIFELGFFAGVLGRKHVCAIVKGDLEIPSDYDGVVYIPYDDSEGWKMKLFRELKSAGIDVDANRVF